MDYDPLRRGFAEFVGTFTLIFIGGGAGIASGHDIVAVALANGLAIGIMVSNLGHISGGHFNPAITLGFVATRRITGALAGDAEGAADLLQRARLLSEQPEAQLDHLPLALG